MNDNYSQMTDEEIKTLDKINDKLRKGKHEEVIELAVKAIKKFPDQIFLYIAHSLAHSELGASAEALKILKGAEKRFPGDYEIYYQMAKVYEDMERYDEAEKFFIKSFEATPEDNFEARSDCMNDLGVIKFNQDKDDEADNYWEKALEINPENNKAKANLYGLYEEEDDDDDEYEDDSFAEDLDEDFHLFHDIQTSKYFREHNIKKFKSKKEKERIDLHILAAWTNKIAGEMDKIVSYGIDEKTKWYSSIEIDYTGEPPEIGMPVIHNHLYDEMVRVFSFLPQKAFPYLEAVGITEAVFQDVMEEEEIPDEDKSKYVWACEIGEKFFKISDSKSEAEFRDRMNEIISIA